MNEKKLLDLLKQARTALKIDKPEIALIRVRDAIKILEPGGPQREPPRPRR